MRITTARDLAAAVRGRRLKLGWSQATAAAAANVSRKWIVDLEGGKSTVDLAAVLRLLDALGLRLHTTEGDKPIGSGSGPAGSTGVAGGDDHIDLDDLLAGYLES